jgi:AraC-like DNA-binding protein
VTPAEDAGLPAVRCPGSTPIRCDGVTVVFRADDVPEPSRADYWHHIVGEAVGPHDVRTEGPFGHHDRLAVADVGPVAVGALSAGAPAEVRRTARYVRRGGSNLCKVHVLAAGRGVVEQDGRQASLRPGDLVFVDLSRPVRWAMSAMRAVAVVFPRELLPLHPDQAAGLTGVRIAGDRGVGAVASSLARQLPRQVDGAGVEGSARLGTAVLDLLTVALASRLGGDTDGSLAGLVPRAATRRALLEQVLAFIEARLADPDLTPGAVAAAHHVSVRSLYSLFETQEITVAGWIRQRRLERCRRDLLDPGQRDVPVSTVAARWGLPDPAHFSRAFRAAYGLPPVEYRRLAGRPASR